MSCSTTYLPAQFTYLGCLCLGFGRIDDDEFLSERQDTAQPALHESQSHPQEHHLLRLRVFRNVRMTEWCLSMFENQLALTRSRVQRPASPSRDDK